MRVYPYAVAGMFLVLAYGLSPSLPQDDFPHVQSLRDACIEDLVQICDLRRLSEESEVYYYPSYYSDSPPEQWYFYEGDSTYYQSNDPIEYYENTQRRVSVKPFSKCDEYVPRLSTKCQSLLNAEPLVVRTSPVYQACYGDHLKLCVAQRILYAEDRHFYFDDLNYYAYSEFEERRLDTRFINLSCLQSHFDDLADDCRLILGTRFSGNGTADVIDLYVIAVAASLLVVIVICRRHRIVAAVRSLVTLFSYACRRNQVKPSDNDDEVSPSTTPSSCASYRVLLGVFMSGISYCLAEYVSHSYISFIKWFLLISLIALGFVSTINFVFNKWRKKDSSKADYSPGLTEDSKVASTQSFSTV